MTSANIQKMVEEANKGRDVHNMVSYISTSAGVLWFDYTPQRAKVAWKLTLGTENPTAEKLRKKMERADAMQRARLAGR